MSEEAYSRIPLRRKDGSVRAYALVDTDDFEAVDASGPWHLTVRGYVCHKGYENGHKWTAYLHRFILGLTVGDGLEADHINRDKLDNRRSNLRIVTRAQNCQNYSPIENSASPFRGVSRSRAKTPTWRARVKLGRREYALGNFPTELEAALAAEAFRREHMPFAQPDPALQAALTEQQS